MKFEALSSYSHFFSEVILVLILTSLPTVAQSVTGISEECESNTFTIQIHGAEGQEALNISGSYSEEKAQAAILSLLNELEQEGYLFAKAEITDLNVLDNCEIQLMVALDRGNQHFTKAILFPGAKANKPEYLSRIAGFRDSVLVTSTLLRGYRSSLIQSELFEDVGTPEIYLEEGNPVVVIPVEERSLNQFDGLVGYVPDASGEGQFVGDFELSLWNVLNQGNGIDLLYQRLRPETSRLNVGVSQDWFGAVPVGAGFKFNLYQNDTTYQTRNLEVGSWYQVQAGLRITGKLGTVTSVTGNSGLYTPEPDGKKWYAELGFRYTNTDYPEVPTRGLRFQVSLGAARKNVEVDSSGTFGLQYGTGDGSWFIPVTRKTVFAISTHAYFLLGDKFTESDLIRFGGANSLRGYSEEQFRASRMLWGDIEYRYLMTRSSYLFAFGGAGGYHRPKLLTESDSAFKTSDILYSTGIGISYKIRIGRLKFTYAVSPQESIGNGMVHLGIVTSL